MFNIGFAELILVLLIAFLIVGPKDLPRVARFLGKCVKWVRGLIAELKAESGWDDMMRETGDIRKDVDEAIKQMDITRELRDAQKELNHSLDDAKRETYREQERFTGERLRSGERAENSAIQEGTGDGLIPKSGETESERKGSDPTLSSWESYKRAAERRMTGTEPANPSLKGTGQEPEEKPEIRTGEETAADRNPGESDPENKHDPAGRVEKPAAK